MGKFISYGRQFIDNNDIRAVIKVLKSDFISQGPKIREFEDALCNYAGAKYAVVVSSGTAALHIACLASGIEAGDEVVTSPITFAASANCILYCGGAPVFADVENDGSNIDPTQIKKKVTKRTKAVIPVHFAGVPCNLKEISKIAEKHNLIIIEDAAHALGAEYKGSKIGSAKYSDMVIFSFHPVKSITTGEGGAVLTNKKDLYEKLLLLRNHGITKKFKDFINPHRFLIHTGSWYYEIQELGFNYRMTDIQAALGVSQLKKLDRFIARRNKIAEFYNGKFKNNPYFDIPAEFEYGRSAYHLYHIRIKNRFKNKKNEIFLKMKQMGLGAQVHYIPVYFHPYYGKLGFEKGLCPNAEDFYNREISIPIFPILKKKQIDYIIKNILKVFNSFDSNE